MKRSAWLALSVVLMLAFVGRGIAQEHPKEHPTEATKEHPEQTKKEHPKEHPEKAEQEHPKEHPTETMKEHPEQTKKEHPKEHPEKAKKEQPKKQPEAKERKAFQDQYEKVVKDYLAAQAEKSGGVFTIKDDKTGKDWKLKLLRVHKNKICMLQEGKSCFACADFKEVGGKAKLDLDFFANISEDGKITMDKVLIHKVNGKPRFTYDDQNNIVPVKD